jgi:undecaprenyl-diphosphatase
MRVLDNIQDFDRHWLLLLQESQGAVARHRRLISRSADGELYLAIAMLLGLLTSAGDVFLLHMLFAFAIERVVYWCMKNTLRRKRPADALANFQSHIVASDEFSFPSGHSCAAFLFVTLLLLHFGLWLLPLYIWSAAVAMSRVYLGVHFPTDTVVGAVLGTSIALATAGWLL